MSIPLLERALNQTGDLIAKVQPDQMELPTPCRSWNVRDLLDHVVDEVNRFATVTGGQKATEGGYEAAAAALLVAWRAPGALERPQQLPFGEVPAAWAVDQQITELTSHAWDIAKATGQSTDLDPELGQRALDWGRQNLLPEFRGDEADGAQIGPEVKVPDDAPLYDRLAAFGGRDPH
ncbi:MAG TPA: TIGR03086 family metal-binding protein [Kribbella sp.]|nr:TIGR03086 family metal-binding protein [Kribbella sp.]